MASRRLRNRSRRTSEAEDAKQEEIPAEAQLDIQPEAEIHPEPEIVEQPVTDQLAAPQTVDAEVSAEESEVSPEPAAEAEVSEAFAALEQPADESDDPWENVEADDTMQGSDEFTEMSEDLQEQFSDDDAVEPISDEAVVDEAPAPPVKESRSSSRRSRRGASSDDEGGGGRGGRSGRRSRRGTAVDEDSSGDSATSGRASSRRRSSSRSGAQSSRKSKKAKAKKILTPEEKRARKRAWSIASSGIFFVVLIVGAVIGLRIALTEEIVERQLTITGQEPVQLTGTQDDVARQVLGQAERALDQLDDAIDRRDAERAEMQYQKALDWLALADIGNGEIENAPLNDPQYADPALVKAAWALRNEVTDRDGALQDLRQGQLVADNINKVNSALAGLDLKLTEEPLVLSDPERSFGILKTRAETVKKLIAAAEVVFAQANAVLMNPVNPQAGPDEVLVDKYSSQLTSLRSQLNNSQGAVDTLRRASIIGPEEGVLAISTVLREKMMYGRAVQMINVLADLYPDANLSSVKSQVISGAQAKWEFVRDIANGHFQDSRAPALAPAQRRAARNNALQALTDVIEQFTANCDPGLGLEPAIKNIVDEATRLRREYTNS
jgi:hypothetical protein